MLNSTSQSRSNVQDQDSTNANLNQTLINLQDTYEKADIAIHEVQLNGDPNPFEDFVHDDSLTPVQNISKEIAAKTAFLKKYVIF